MQWQSVKQFKDWKKSWSIDTRIEKELQMEYFLLLDEFAALRIALDKKEFAEITTV